MASTIHSLSVNALPTLEETKLIYSNNRSADCSASLSEQSTYLQLRFHCASYLSSSGKQSDKHRRFTESTSKLEEFCLEEASIAVRFARRILSKAQSVCRIR